MRRLVSDELWSIVEPLLPPSKPRRFRYPGRRPVDNRVALTAILFVLKSGIAWEDVPQELGCCGMTAWNKLREWQELGVARVGSGKSWEWQELGVARVGSGKSWEWQELGVARVGSGKSWEW